MFEEPERCLSGAAEFQNLVEDHADRFPNPAVRVLLIAITRLDETYRRADDEFSAPSLIMRRQRTLTQQIEFVLVETPLGAKQKPVVTMPRCIDRLLIDQHGVDDATHLDQLLPIPAVPSKARDLSRGDSADSTETDLRHHQFKAGALDAARDGTAEVIVINQGRGMNGRTPLTAFREGLPKPEAKKEEKIRTEKPPKQLAA